MSRYQEIRFKGIVKKELREHFEPIALYGKWVESPDPVLRDFGECHTNASCIPRSDSVGNYAVERWNNTSWERKYDKETGEWQFQVAININRNWMFLTDWEDEILPYLIESIEHYEVWDEPIADDPSPKETALLAWVKDSLEVVGIIDENGNYIARK